MSYEHAGPRGLDYLPCRYGDSRLVCRGPKATLEGNYTICLGGTETYGKFIPRPFPDLLDKRLPDPCVNFGCVNAGIDVFLGDPALLQHLSDAGTVVVQVMGAQNMSNRFYRVHPRRNDRFVGASEIMKTIFSDIDFTEFHFTRHMLDALSARAPRRFSLLRDELQQAWVARMRLLLGYIPGRRVLFWFAARSPDDAPQGAGLGLDPLFVTREMIDALRDHVTDYVEVVASPEALARGAAGMVYAPMERDAARRMLGPAVHEMAAKRLGDLLT